MIHAPLISTLVGGFVLAFLLGAAANWLRLSPLVGYLIAGIVVGPYSPGFVADGGIAQQLAEIGVILLMFGVGLHFSLDDLLSLRGLVLPGALLGIISAATLGTLLGLLLGFPLGGAVVFGLCLSVASTVVLMRMLEDRGLVESRRGRIAIGWLIVEDLAMVLALVLLPALAPALKEGGGSILARFTESDLWVTLGLTIGKVGLFVAIMLIIGRRVIPWGLQRIALTGSRELFTLALLAIALGVAFAAAELSGASFALGAFFAGMVLSGSDLSHDAAQQTLPLRDAFAVLFFVSVGMLLDPHAIIAQPLPVIGVMLTIIVGKGVFSYAIIRLFGYPKATAGMVGISLAQIGEFSFILATLGVQLGLLTDDARDLILAGSIGTIILNPFMVRAYARLESGRDTGPAVETVAEEVVATPVAYDLLDHVILVGYGRVGSRTGPALAAAGVPFVVIERLPDRMEQLRAAGVRALVGNAERPEVLLAAGIKQARAILVAIPNGFEAGNIVAQARSLNPQVEVIARAHFDAEVEHLKAQGAQIVLMAENELAERMATLALDGYVGLPAAVAQQAEAEPLTGDGLGPDLDAEDSVPLVNRDSETSELPQPV